AIPQPAAAARSFGAARDAGRSGARRRVPLPSRCFVRDGNADLALGRLGAVRRLVLAIALLALASRAQAAPDTGTFSIVACDTATGELGVAVIPRATSVRALAPGRRAPVGRHPAPRTSPPALPPPSP